MAIELPSLPQNLVTGLLETVDILHQYRIRYALIGGLATGYRTRPRFTQDIDLMLEIPQVTLPGVLEKLAQRGFTIDLDATIRRWLTEHLAVFSFRGVRIDWLKPVIPCYKHVLYRVTSENRSGKSVHIASAEGLIITKLIAFRAQDQLDIQNIPAANQSQLDISWIREEWNTVGDADDPKMKRFDEMLVEFYGQ